MKYLRDLLKARSNWFEDHLYGHAEADGYGYITPAMNRLFVTFVQMGGVTEPVSLPDLGRRLVVTRQALHQVVTEAVKYGLMELQPHPINKKMKMVRFTAKGIKMHKRAAKFLQHLEREVEAKIGTKKLETLRKILEMGW